MGLLVATATATPHVDVLFLLTVVAQVDTVVTLPRAHVTTHPRAATVVVDAATNRRRP